MYQSVFVIAEEKNECIIATEVKNKKKKKNLCIIMFLARFTADEAV